MEKIVISEDRCIGCGLCVHANPEYIEFNEMGQAEPLNKEINPNDKAKILESVESCPTEAIKVEEIKEDSNL